MYRLIRSSQPRAQRPLLDASQQAVVDHPAGPLLVLAGPGTGKTTTLVESVVDRIERRGVSPDGVLMLTFSRRAAADLRTRITARLGRTVLTPAAMTFHAFCYALVRRFAATEELAAPARLLTGPEQEFRVREILQGSRETGRATWPDGLVRAFPTRAFAGEVRAVLAKARQLGMDPEDISASGHAAGRPEWVAVGEFFDEYLDVLDAEGVLDYAELVHRTRILLADPAALARLRREISWVFVDEYQDTDPSQVQLLQALAGGGRDLVVVGDPDQSIYAFRGAEARGILDFPDLFRTAAGAPAPVLALDTTRRFGANLLAASRNVAERLGIARSIPAPVLGAFRHPSAGPGLARGSVEIFTCDSPGAEAEHIAELLRSAHLRDGLGWTEMAVLVRSGRLTIPGLSRALVAAGVPVEVAGDEIPLASDQAVRPLLLALRVAARGRTVSPADAHALLTSPLGGLDSMGVRRLGRNLRQAERAELAGTGPPRLSGELVALAVRDPELLSECPPSADQQAAADPGNSAPRLRAVDQAWRHRGRGAVAALAGFRLAGAAAAGLGFRRRSRQARQSGSRCGLRAVRHRRPLGGGGRTARRHWLPGRGRGPADPGGHPSRVRDPWCGRPVADRSPGQGSGMGSGRGRGRPGGCLAGRTAARLAAGAGSAGPPRAVRAAADRGPDRGGAAAVLRRLHPRPIPAGRDGRCGHRGGGKPAVPVPGRARRARTGAGGPAAAAALARRADRRAAPGDHRSGGDPRPAGAGRPAAGEAGRRQRCTTAARSPRPPVPTDGGGCVRSATQPTR